MNVTTRLKEIRKSKKLSSFKVARETDTSRRYIQKMKKGFIKPPIPLLIALEDLYHEPLFALYGQERPKDFEEIMKHPEMRKISVGVTTTRHAQAKDSLDGIYEELFYIYNKYLNFPSLNP